jgi:hypothetical protein
MDFQGMQGRPDVRDSIEKHVTELERRYGRITACRVVVKGPSGHPPLVRPRGAPDIDFATIRQRKMKLRRSFVCHQ